MVVLTQFRHPGNAGIVGLHIGDLNVQQYFPRNVGLVELELDHLRIVCHLESSFWEGRPEIQDSRLSIWLEAKRKGGKLAPAPAPVAMIPCGEHAFRLEIMRAGEEELAPLTATKLVVAAQTPSSLAAMVPSLNKRKYDRGHSPERRRVARLKSDERPSSTTNH